MDSPSFAAKFPMMLCCVESEDQKKCGWTILKKATRQKGIWFIKQRSNPGNTVATVSPQETIKQSSSM